MAMKKSASQIHSVSDSETFGVIGTLTQSTVEESIQAPTVRRTHAHVDRDQHEVRLLESESFTALFKRRGALLLWPPSVRLWGRYLVV